MENERSIAQTNCKEKTVKSHFGGTVRMKT